MDSNLYDISVIVCCYNPDILKLKNTLMSVINQDGVKFEIVITDDGSNSFPQEWVVSFFEEHMFNDYKLVLNEKNVGTVLNILSATKHVNSNYIKIISPGDYFYDKNSLKKYYEVLNDSKSDMVFSKAVYYNQNNIINISSPAYPKIFKNMKLDRNIIVFNDYILGAAIASKKDNLIFCLNKICGSVLYVEDIPLTFISLLCKKKVTAIPEYLIWYEYGYGISTSGINDRLKKDYDVFYDYLVAEYDCSIVRKSYKNYKTRYYKKVKKFFAKVFLTYDYIFHYFVTRIHCLFAKHRKFDMQDLNKIISEVK